MSETLTDEEFLIKLGIETFNIDTSNTVKKIKCLVITNDTFNNKELALLEKMLAAINLTKNDYVISNNTNNYEYQIAFGINTNLVDNPKHFILNSPKDILVNSSLKKSAWDILQQAQKLIN